MAADDGESNAFVAPMPHSEEEEEEEQPPLTADGVVEPIALPPPPPPPLEEEEPEEQEEKAIMATEAVVPPFLPPLLQQQPVVAARLPQPFESGTAPVKGNEVLRLADESCKEILPYQYAKDDSLNAILIHTRCCSRYKLAHAKVHFPVAASLSNPENWTCFANCILQCLAHTVPFVSKILKDRHPDPCPTDEFCCYCFMKHHVSEVLRHSGEVLYPRKFIKRLNLILRDFKRGQHQDAHEFLRCLLDKLDEVSVTPRSKSEEPSSIVKEFFGGQQKSQLNCSNCGHCSDRLESFLDLNLEVNQTGDLTDLLSSFTSTEVIEDYPCDGCKTRVNMRKCLKVEQAPEVLVIQLKRFQNLGEHISKIRRIVKYPFELDLKPFMSSMDDEPHTYDLYGVVEHYGEVGTGHYVCYVRSSQSDWFLLNDDKVVKMSQDELVQKQAYMLFYVKQDESLWFSTLLERKEMLLSDYFEELAGKELDEDGASKSGSYSSSESDDECVEQHDAGSHGGSSQENGRSCNLLQSSSHKNKEDCCPENLTLHKEDEMMGLCDSPAGSLHVCGSVGTSRIRPIGSISDRIVNDGGAENRARKRMRTQSAD